MKLGRAPPSGTVDHGALRLHRGEATWRWSAMAGPAVSEDSAATGCRGPGATTGRSNSRSASTSAPRAAAGGGMSFGRPKYPKQLHGPPIVHCVVTCRTRVAHDSPNSDPMHTGDRHCCPGRKYTERRTRAFFSDRRSDRISSRARVERSAILDFRASRQRAANAIEPECADRATRARRKTVSDGYCDEHERGCDMRGPNADSARTAIENVDPGSIRNWPAI